MRLAQFKNEILEALKIRLVEEKLLQLFSEGKLNGTVHTAIGQEFTGVFVSKYLIEDDFVTSNHRGHGHYLARFGNVKGLISELMGKVAGVSGGMGGSQHIVDRNYLSNGIQGGMLPIAAGVAFYNKNILNSAISVSYIGDGTLGEGIVYETMNLASVYELPMLVILENNGIAQSTSMKQSFRGDLKSRVNGFGWEFRQASSRNLKDMDSTIKEAVNFVRSNEMPLFLEIESYRLMSHSKGDDNRRIEEIKELQINDVLNKLLGEQNNWLNKEKKRILEEIETIVEEVLILPSLDSTNFTQEIINSKPQKQGLDIENVSTARYNTLIYEALKTALKRNTKSIIIGEDIQNTSEFTEFEYGGAFKVTRNLSDLFPGRVLNSPISEAALFGFATGHSIKAGRSFAEIMFGDFTTLIFDQVLQHASKFKAMYNGQVNCPVVIRTPMGGKRGYGPTHSQSIEKHFLGIDNFVVIALNHRINPIYIYSALEDIDNPVMVLENKILYTLVGNKKKPTGYVYEFSDQLFPELRIKPNRFDSTVTILCYGEVLNDVEDALKNLMINEEIFCDVICPTLISEIDINHIEKSIQKTLNLLIVEEGSGFASWGSEVVSLLKAQGKSDFALKRWSNDLTIPSSFSAEKALLPSSQKIYQLVKTMSK